MADILLTEEERLLKSTVRDFAEREIAPRAAQLDEREEFPWENMRGLAGLGLTGLTVDPQYGGSGGSYKQLAVAIEEIARACAATAVTYIAHLSLATHTIYHHGSEEQKQRYVPPLARGERLAAWCLTEPGAGSDAASIATSVARRGGDYVLNGTKNFITNASVAGTFTLFATHDRSLRARGISCFILEKGMRGLSATRLPGKMGLRGSDTCQVHLEDVIVPAANRIGEEGQGFKIAMQVLDASRVSIAAQGVGVAQAAFEQALAYSRERQAFGGPIANLQAIQFMLADMATRVDAARLLTHRAALLLDSSQPYILEASMAKLYATEAAVYAADRAVQVHGGYGYFKPSPVERLYRDARVLTIYEGTSEVQRLLIARQLVQQGQ